MSKRKYPTYKETCLYMCHYCSGEYTDGKVDCKAYNCPNYWCMPYGDKTKANLDFMEYNPRRKGKIPKDAP